MSDSLISNIFCLSVFFAVAVFKAIIERFYFKDEDGFKRTVKYGTFGSVLLMAPLFVLILNNL